MFAESYDKLYTADDGVLFGQILKIYAKEEGGEQITGINTSVLNKDVIRPIFDSSSYIIPRKLCTEDGGSDF